jgi:hypothetical protein
MLWLKDDILIENSGISYTFKDAWNRTLSLVSANLTHTGQYTCQVRLRSGGFPTVTASATVTVLGECIVLMGVVVVVITKTAVVVVVVVVEVVVAVVVVEIVVVIAVVVVVAIIIIIIFTCETGIGQQVAELHDRYMMMIIFTLMYCCY